MKIVFLSISIIFIGTTTFAFGAATDYMTKLEHDGCEYVVSSDYSAENNVVIKQDLNGDMQPDILLGFQAYSGPKVKAPASFMVLGKEEKGKFILQHIIQGNDRFDKVELVDIDKDGSDEIVFWSGGGMHYTTLRIYRYNDAKLKCLFANGSACGIKFEPTGAIPAIRVGRANWDKEGWCYADEPLWEVWEWKGKRFQYNRPQSTTLQAASEQKETGGLLGKYEEMVMVEDQKE